MSMTFVFRQKWISVIVFLISVFQNTVTNVNYYVCAPCELLIVNSELLACHIKILNADTNVKMPMCFIRIHSYIATTDVCIE